MNYFCCDKLRRNLIKGTARNGIDFLEVLDSDALTDAARQRTLYVHFINDLTIPLVQGNFRIEGGERVRGIRVTNVTLNFGGDAKVAAVDVDPFGDYSIYTLRVVQDATHGDPPAGLDPFFAAVEFSFKVECPSDFDCKPKRICPPERVPEPEIDYLAKDYASFRQLMLNRMAVIMPQWRERNPADLGVALVELLAYAGDHLSYEQDAIATEAYLGTARRRVSVRRLARLVDYFLHEGCNARAWTHVHVTAASLLLPKGRKLLSRTTQPQPRLTPNSREFADALREKPIVFETMHDVLLFEANNDLNFYTWGDDRCCLPKGATAATLLDDPAKRLRLLPGDVLVFEERIGPNTGLEADADPKRRHAVRLTRVNPEAVSVLDSNEKEIDRTPTILPLTDPVDNNQAIVEIEWASDDALPFALCISGKTDKQHGGQPTKRVSVAHGNIVLADHGLTIAGEPLGTVPQPEIFRPPTTGSDRCAERERTPVPPRFRPSPQQRPLTHAAPFAFPPLSATAAMHPPVRELLPSITLNAEWRPHYDLLGSSADHTGFVVETENDGRAFLRFGDGQHGMRPTSGTAFTAHYRVGNGTSGNIGAGALYHIVSSDSGITSVRNPMPAQGGSEPESIEDVRQRAPSAFRTQERAVTEADYAEVTERDPRVQQAAATFRWTGSWHTVFLTIDRLGGLEVDANFKRDIAAHVDRFRMAGHDLEINQPHFVSLEIEMHVCVEPDYFRSDVKEALLDLFSNRVFPDGRGGLFHPDKFSFGQTVYLSPLYAAAQALPGVASVHITTFKRQGSTNTSALDEGFLKLDRLEIARLDNDRNFAERGVFTLTMGGGK